jgi:hypothetical protein
VIGQLQAPADLPQKKIFFLSTEARDKAGRNLF